MERAFGNEVSEFGKLFIQFGFLIHDTLLVSFHGAKFWRTRRQFASKIAFCRCHRTLATCQTLIVTPCIRPATRF